MRRGGHLKLTDSEALADVPVLDDQESNWTQGQRDALAQALVRLGKEDRVLCDRFYIGSIHGMLLGMGMAVLAMLQIRAADRLKQLDDTVPIALALQHAGVVI